MSKKPKKICTSLNYIEHFLILGFAITEFLLLLFQLVQELRGITSSTIVITATIKKYQSIIKKKKKKHDKTVLLPKSKLNNIEVLFYKALFDSFISHDEFFLIKCMLKEYNEMKKEIKIQKLKQFIQVLVYL